MDILPIVGVRKSSNYSYEVALGLRSGTETWNKLGDNPNFGNNEVTIASFGNFTRLTNAEILTIAFPDAADRTGGTGMQSVVIYGVGDGWVPQIEVVSGSGATVDTIIFHHWLLSRTTFVILCTLVFICCFQLVSCQLACCVIFLK